MSVELTGIGIVKSKYNRRAAHGCQWSLCGAQRRLDVFQAIDYCPFLLSYHRVIMTTNIALLTSWRAPAEEQSH
jgi:hypothetical protein